MGGWQTTHGRKTDTVDGDEAVAEVTDDDTAAVEAADGDAVSADVVTRPQPESCFL